MFTNMKEYLQNVYEILKPRPLLAQMSSYWINICLPVEAMGAREFVQVTWKTTGHALITTKLNIRI